MVRDRPRHPVEPSSANLSNPDDLTVTYPYIDGIETENIQQPQPLMLHGKVEVIAPGKVVNFKLSANDVGQTRTEGSISVTLLALGKNFAEVDIRNSAALAEPVRDIELNPLIIQAHDLSGQFLSRAGSINENAEQLAFYQQQLAEMLKQTAWSEAFEQQLRNEQADFDKNTPITTARSTSTARSNMSTSACSTSRPRRSRVKNSICPYTGSTKTW